MLQQFIIPGENVRTKLSHPYSYDPILCYVGEGEGKHTVYTDRFMGWYGYDKIRELQRKHFQAESDYYDRFEVSAIQSFLRELSNKPELVITRIEEHCDQSSGYPTWRIDYR